MKKILLFTALAAVLAGPVMPELLAQTLMR